MIVTLSIVIAVGILAFLLFLLFVAYRLVSPPREIGEWSPSSWDVMYHTVELRTEDDVNLQGWWIDNESSLTVIVLHGYTASRWNDVYMQPMLKALSKAGYNVLTFDFRAHGKSEGERTSIGNLEVRDLQAAVSWLKQKQKKRAKKIGVIGYSMGGIVTIRGLARDKRITCGIADSPPIDLDKTAARSLRHFAHLPKVLYPLIKPLCQRMSEVKTLNLFKDAKEIQRPLLLITGQKDSLVHEEEVKAFHEENRKVNGRVDLWISDAKHVRSIQRKPEEYKEKVLSFLKDYLGSPNGGILSQFF